MPVELCWGVRADFTSVHMDEEGFNGQRQKLEKLLDSDSLKQLQIRDPSFDY
jgi:hypothetical protein